MLKSKPPATLSISLLIYRYRVYYDGHDNYDDHDDY
jgi:hypothetical protein